MWTIKEGNNESTNECNKCCAECMYDNMSKWMDCKYRCLEIDKFDCITCRYEDEESRKEREDEEYDR
ncbi:MAG: hypothetical protein ACRCX8_05275 [Sarcina sp.]